MTNNTTHTVKRKSVKKATRKPVAVDYGYDSDLASLAASDTSTDKRARYPSGDGDGDLDWGSDDEDGKTIPVTVIPVIKSGLHERVLNREVSRVPKYLMCVAVMMLDAIKRSTPEDKFEEVARAEGLLGSPSDMARTLHVRLYGESPNREAMDAHFKAELEKHHQRLNCIL